MFSLFTLAALLLTPAADSSRWLVMNHGRPAGDLVVMTSRDSVVSRFVFRDRNRGTRVETRYRLGANGAVVAGESRPVLPDGTVGQPGDRFEVVGDSIVYGTMRSALRTGSWVGLRNGTPWDDAALARHLLGRPERSAAIAPSGRARAEVIADTLLRVGARRQRARLVMIYRGTSTTPSGVWLDENGALLSTDAQWFITVRESAVPLMESLRAIELRWRNAQGEAISAKVRLKTTGLVVFKGGDVFDSETGTMRPRQTVIVQGDRILRVGPVDSIPIPADASVFDITGKTIMPGMWEMHTHVQVSNQGSGSLMQLAQGLTTARDMAADLDVAVSQRDRERAGKLASPRLILAGFMEGLLAWAGPTAAIASNEAEARAWVARYDSLGYKQVKLYNVLHPDLVPVIAAEAKQRGMRLSGHIPRGMSVRAAVSLGFDEIQHAAFLFSDFYPDSLYLPQMRAYSIVATAVAPRIDVDSPGMTSLVNFLAEHQTVIDGTFNLWIGGGASVVGAGGSSDQSRADSAYVRLIRRLYDAGVPLVAGTDNTTGTTYRRELEMYALAGIPAPRVLQIATIDAARVMKEDRDYGSIVAGKVADLIVVNGRPAERIGDLARVETVVRGGRVYRVTDLLGALGSSTVQ
ncbi:MAG: amidohydrolase family protein [Cytophagaceae bacterium]|nr:amidohydrolase family protein [Gemmatimonadaceae bacterium]